MDFVSGACASPPKPNADDEEAVAGLKFPKADFASGVCDSPPEPNADDEGTVAALRLPKAEEEDVPKGEKVVADGAANGASLFI
jgi:hypothetical protein